MLLGIKVAHYATKQILASDMISKSEATRLLNEWKDTVRDRIVHELSAWVGSDSESHDNERHDGGGSDYKGAPSSDNAPEVAEARIIRETKQPNMKRSDTKQQDTTAPHSGAEASPPFMTDTLKNIYQSQGRATDMRRPDARATQVAVDETSAEEPSTTQETYTESNTSHDAAPNPEIRSRQNPTSVRRQKATTSLECNKKDTHFFLKWRVSDRKLGKLMPDAINTDENAPVLILRQITFWLSGASPSIDDHPIFTISKDQEWTGEINRRLPKQPWASVAFSIGVLETLGSDIHDDAAQQHFRSLAHIIVER